MKTVAFGEFRGPDDLSLDDHYIPSVEPAAIPNCAVLRRPLRSTTASARVCAMNRKNI
jgi:hypothetical protein